MILPVYYFYTQCLSRSGNLRFTLAGLGSVGACKAGLGTLRAWLGPFDLRLGGCVFLSARATNH